MSEPVPTPDLVRRLHAGDAGAADQLFTRYVDRLTRVARQHLARRVAVRVDAEDVVQSVFRTFFRRSAGGEFQLNDSLHLWRLLVKITIRKARAQARHHTAEMRDVGAESPGGAWLPEALAQEPGPAEAVALTDLIEAGLRGLPAVYREVLEMRLGGHTVAEIAGCLDVSRQTVYRALDLLQGRFLADEPAS